MSNPTFSWRVDEDAPLLLRTFLREKKQVSKRLLAAVKFKGGLLRVNEMEATVRHVVKTGDLVTMVLPPESPSLSLQPEQLLFGIPYEDEHLLVADKPGHMATIPSRDRPGGSLANGVLHYYKQQHLQATFHAVNRLDRGTSGLLIVAKHRYAHDLLSRLQQQGGVKRCYKALVTGVLSEKAGIINAPIDRKPGSIIEREVGPGGKSAITHYKVEAESKTHSLVSLQLETGRTHQIRVHFAYIGHPLVGDGLYGDHDEALAHQALHCDRVALTHPFTDEVLYVEKSLPKEWRPFVEGMHPIH
ncbi:MULTISPECIES: RluA family pseudouridine synthase [Shouchella]|uniref:RluA family pseudouridine synthase n=1 Tax=Shouchella TaxID=2893057 RepID=UPI000912BED4|nr:MULTISPECIES: RluA family pseudouridine synthase [Shouchella]MCM3313246.1 RluA family pseudouridine synthase [Psychrobacillus sp. MER TA 17]MBX0317733.1 RluA family pseudouridine synthase [Shouchella clausii]MCZ1180637.1 RluA family pseudouridine synthase [Shouchella clausii]PAD47111.1 pseudouridine synthase [Shouchella clausii]SHL41343.1 23S rRNA pseudouridine1911/1915/1917 synthase [Shouchella rhizosphaerae]